MAGATSAVVVGTGMGVPSRVVTNDDLSQWLDTSDDWIRTRTGIRERRWVEPGEQASTDLAEIAARQALEAAGLEPAALDLVVVGTCTPDHPVVPACAPLLARRLGADRAAGFDVSLGCSGFLAAITTGEQYLRAGVARCVLVVGVDVLSGHVDPNDRSTAVIFGDGAGAVVLRPGSEVETGGEIVYRHLGMRGDDRSLCVPAGGSRRPLRPGMQVGPEHFVHMAGRETFRVAVATMIEEVERAAEALGCRPQDFDLFVPHQANERIIRAVVGRAGVPMERVVLNIDRYGNTSGASVPIALHEAVAAGRVRPGETVVLVAFGGGLSWGVTVLRWR